MSLKVVVIIILNIGFHILISRFQNMNIEFLALSLNGTSIPAKPFQPNFPQHQSVREFYNIFLATNRHMKDNPLCIDREDFENGYSLFVLNLARDDELDNEAISMGVDGTCRLDLRFRTALQRTVSLVVYACYDSMIQINSRRQVLMEY